MIVDPGQFRTKLTLQTLSTTLDSVGDTVRTWTDAGTIWGKVSPLSVREQFWASQVHATTTHLVTCRYNPAITPQTRLKFAGADRVLNVEGVRDVDELHVYMIISCTEATPSE